MGKREKIRIGVLYGGRSGEHDVSLVSATNVIENLDRTLFEVIPIGIDKQGSWYLGNDSAFQELLGSRVLQLNTASENMLFNPHFLQKNTLANPRASVSSLDVVFPVVHGVLCEDGTLQGLLESVNIPYVGCGVLASAVGMDKDFSKRLIQNAGIAIADYVTIKRGEWNHHATMICQSIAQRLPFPIFVKPANTGSSVGVYKVKNAHDLKTAIDKAFQYDTKVVVEQGIDAIELEVAVLESQEYGADPIVSVVGEVRPRNHEFYSYAAKYLDESGAELFVPAAISPKLQKEVQQIAKTIFNALDCEGMSRVDLFLERQTNRIYFNEVNTIPGFTSISMYPKLMAASGMNYADLLTHLIRLAIARHERKSQLNRECVAEDCPA